MTPHTEGTPEASTNPELGEFEAEFSPDDTVDSYKTPLVIKLLVAATFVVILNETIMLNAIPHLMADFDVKARDAQWISSIFMLTMAAVIPITGWFLQRVTTRTAYTIAMTTFGIGTIICGTAPIFEMLLVGRAVQAAGTAVMMPLLMTTVMTVVPEQARGRVMGNMMLAISVAPAMGPAVSGLILNLGSWRLIFAFMLPMAVIVSVLSLRHLKSVGETNTAPVSWFSVADCRARLQHVGLRSQRGRRPQHRPAGAADRRRRRSGRPVHASGSCASSASAARCSTCGRSSTARSP